MTRPEASERVIHFALSGYSAFFLLRWSWIIGHAIAAMEITNRMIVSGRLYRPAQLPLPTTGIWLKLVSISLPSTTPTTTGAAGYLYFFIIQPSRPKMRQNTTCKMFFYTA